METTRGKSMRPPLRVNISCPELWSSWKNFKEVCPCSRCQTMICCLAYQTDKPSNKRQLTVFYLILGSIYFLTQFYGIIRIILFYPILWILENNSWHLFQANGVSASMQRDKKSCSWKAAWSCEMHSGFSLKTPNTKTICFLNNSWIIIIIRIIK